MQKIDNTSEIALPIKSTSGALIVLLFCCTFAVFLKGWQAFFVGLAIMPVGTVVELLGISLVPFILGLLGAKVIGIYAKAISFKHLWLITSTLICLIMLVGQYRSHDIEKQSQVAIEAQLDKLDDAEMAVNTQLDKLDESAPNSLKKTDPLGSTNVESPVQAAKPSSSPVELDNERWKFNYYSLTNPVMARLSGSRKVVQVALTIMTHYDDRVIQNVKRHELAIRAEILEVMRTKTEDDLKDPKFRLNLAEEIRIVMNKTLEKYEGFGGIEEVMFAEFVVQ